jgi:hypothetical protein
MFKKCIIPLIVLMFTMVSFSVAFAAEGSEGPLGNDRKGKYTYRKVYKACAATGEIESASPTISPADKTMGQWKDIFENKTFNDFGCGENWAALSDEDVLDIYSYFYHHASDSPTPATCK